MVILYFPHYYYIYQLELFCMEDVAISQVYLQYKLMDVYFIQEFIQYHYFISHFIPSLVIGISFRLAPVSF